MKNDVYLINLFLILKIEFRLQETRVLYAVFLFFLYSFFYRFLYRFLYSILTSNEDLSWVILWSSISNVMNFAFVAFLFVIFDATPRIQNAICVLVQTEALLFQQGHFLIDCIEGYQSATSIYRWYGSTDSTHTQKARVTLRATSRQE